MDESFGRYVSAEWEEASERAARGERTNKPQRILELVARFSHRPQVTEQADISYQLLYSVAGTVDAGAEVSLMYVAVFKTDAYRERYGEKNYTDYLRFMEHTGATPIPSAEPNVIAYRLHVGDRELVAIHEYFDWR